MKFEERINNLENQMNILSNNFKENKERSINLEKEINYLREATQKNNIFISNKLDTLIDIIGKNIIQNNKGSLNNPSNPFIKAAIENDKIGNEKESEEEMYIESSSIIKSDNTNSIDKKKIKKKYKKGDLLYYWWQYL